MINTKLKPGIKIKDDKGRIFTVIKVNKVNSFIRWNNSLPHEKDSKLWTNSLYRFYEVI